jgi:hypothetical protein
MTPNDSPDHRQAPDDERAVREAALDQTIENSFPASDPPSTNPNPYDRDALPARAAREQADQLTGFGRASRARSGAARRGPS